MSGILDKKSRVLDSIITLEGRRQLSEGGINIRYVTFTDNATFYAADVDNGSADATLRLYLESCHLPQDEITFQSNESGRLQAFKASADKAIRNGQLFKTDFNPPSESEYLSGSDESMFVTTALNGSVLQDEAMSLLTSSIDNYRNLQALGTKDSIFDESEFAIGNKNVEFIITPNKPVPEDFGYIADISQLENISSDARFSNLLNFRYLPPINRTDEINDKTNPDNLKKYLLGSYASWGSMPSRALTQKEILDEHSYYANNGFLRKINFDPTSYDNNLFFQAFEVSRDSMFKLDIIDFGVRQSKNNTYKGEISSLGQVTHTFFIGKLITKTDTNTHSFVHLFTLIFG